MNVSNTVGCVSLPRSIGQRPGPGLNRRLYSVQYTSITLLTNILAMFVSPHIPEMLHFHLSYSSWYQFQEGSLGSPYLNYPSISLVIVVRLLNLFPNSHCHVRLPRTINIYVDQPQLTVAGHHCTIAEWLSTWVSCVCQIMNCSTLRPTGRDLIRTSCTVI